MEPEFNSMLIVIVNSRFPERPQRRSGGNHLIHRRLSKTKSISSRSDPESQASRRLWWMVFVVEMGRQIGRRGWV